MFIIFKTKLIVLRKRYNLDMLGGLNSEMLSQPKKVEDLIYKQFFSYLNTSLHEYQNLYLKGKIKM